MQTQSFDSVLNQVPKQIWSTPSFRKELRQILQDGLKQIKNAGGSTPGLKYFEWVNLVSPLSRCCNKQRLLLRWVADICNDLDVVEQVQIGHLPDSHQRLELDVYVPELNLALEYQGQQHYWDGMYQHHSANVQSFRDQLKRQACRQFGIKLIQVPFWWNGDRNSIAQLLNDNKDELYLDNSKEWLIQTHKTDSIDNLPSALLMLPQSNESVGY
jgi:hypothetical protein